MKNNIIEYSIGDTLKSAIKFVTNLENDSIMRFVISNNDTSYPIIDKTFLMDDDGIFTVELTPSERKKLTLGQYLYKIIINGVDGSVKTRQSGYFRVIWGAAEDNVLNVSTGYQAILSFDTVPKEGSNNPVTSDGIYKFVKENSSGGGSIIVDDELSMESENPVQNKVVTKAITNKVDKVDGYGLVAVWNAMESSYPNGRKEYLSINVHDGESGQTLAYKVYDTSQTDAAISNAIGDVNTALENIIEKYGLGGDAS